MRCKIFDGRDYGTDQKAMNALLDEGFIPADITTIYELVEKGKIPPNAIGYASRNMYVSGVIASDYGDGIMRMALPRELRNLKGIKGFMIGCEGERLRCWIGADSFGADTDIGTNRFVGVSWKSPRRDSVDTIIDSIDAELKRRTR